MLYRDTAVNTVTVSQAVKQLSAAYVALVKGNIPLQKFPSVMLWGAPGVGKSQGVRQIAKEIEDKTGKRVIVTDVRLLLFNPVDLRGIPTSNADKTLAVWLKPKIFQMDESDSVINILFLDEISAAPQSVQAAAYQITLDRRIGEHELPENCAVIAAGNRVTDRSVAYTMPKALANRLCHITVESEYKSWREWAINNGINPLVIGFLDSNRSSLMQFDSDDEVAFATPRSWEMVSNILNCVSSNVRETFTLISGCIGEATAGEFLCWSEAVNRLPSLEAICSGRTAEVPVRPESLLALTDKLLSRARKGISLSELENLINYTFRLPTEFQYKLFNGLLKEKTILPKLKKIEAFGDWLYSDGKDWEDYD